MSHWNQIIAWNPEQVAELRRLWDEGLSTRLIGLRMGVTKNAVIGKANRLGLSPRPTPIQRSQALATQRLAASKAYHKAAKL